jgi:nitroimidazol reductase NimA-like FMN-containing flavoprotein (pyridoxamine 5'-phosphate oxidase superfamily)
MVGELNKDQINNVLSSQVLGRLACSKDGQPYIVPVTYTYDGAFIYGQTNEGVKLDILRANPTVCFETDIMLNMRNWQSVVVYGVFEELEGTVADEARETLFNRVYPLLTSSTVHTFQHEVTTEVDDTTRVKTVMYRIKIDKVTGRFEKQS